MREKIPKRGDGLARTVGMTNEPTIEQLFLRFRTAQDLEALAAVFDRTAPRLLLLAAHVTPDRSAAEDLLQETFLQAMERSAQWDPARPLLPWLGGILRHRAQDLARRLGLRRTPELDEVVQVANEPGPADSAATTELLERVHEAMDALASPYREALVLRITHGLQPTAIAHALGRPPATVRVQLKRGLELLRGSLPASLAGALAVLLVAERGLVAVRQAVVGGERMAAAGSRSGSWLAAAFAALGLVVAGAWWSLGERAPLAPAVASNGAQQSGLVVDAQGRDGAAAVAPRRDAANAADVQGVVATSTLRGRLVDAASRAPIAGGAAKVSFGRGRFVTEDAGFRRYPESVTAQANAAGVFAVTFAPVAETSVTLEVQAPGFVEADTQWTSVRNGIDVDLGTIALLRGCELRLRTVDEHGVPVPGIWLMLERQSSGVDANEGAFITFSGIGLEMRSDGRNLPRTVYANSTYGLSLDAQSPGYRIVGPAELVIHDEAVLALDVIVARTEGESTKGSGLGGRVVDERGVPVAGLTLSADDAFLDMGSATTAADGTFWLVPEIPPQELPLYLATDERRFRLAEPDRTYTRGSKDNVVQVVRQPVFDVPLQVVHARTGEPVREFGAFWTLDHWTEAMRFSMPPDRIYRPVAAAVHDDGRMLLPGLLPGAYRLCVWPGDASLATAYLVPFEVKATGPEPVRVELDGRAPLRVQVRDETGAPFAGVEVGLVHALLTGGDFSGLFSVEQFARGVGGGRETAILLQTRTTDRDGRCDLEAPIGEARLLLRGHGPQCSQIDQRLEPVPAEGADVALTVQRCARIIGRVGPADWLAAVGPTPQQCREDAIVRPEDSDITCYCPVVWLEPLAENARGGGRGHVLPDGTFRIDSVPPGDYRIVCGPDRGAWPATNGGDEVQFGDVRGLQAGELREVACDASAHRPARLRGTVLVDGQPWIRGRFGLLYTDDDRVRHAVLDLQPGGVFERRVRPGTGYLPFVVWQDAAGEHHLFADRRIEIAPGADLDLRFPFESRVQRLTAAQPGPVEWRALDFSEVHELLGDQAVADAQGVVTFDPAPPGRIELVVK